jgi:hypothetical protein
MAYLEEDFTIAVLRDDPDIRTIRFTDGKYSMGLKTFNEWVQGKEWKRQFWDKFFEELSPEDSLNPF